MNDNRRPKPGVGFMRDGVFHGGTPASYGEWKARQGRLAPEQTVTPEGVTVGRGDPEEGQRQSNGLADRLRRARSQQIKDREQARER